MFNPYNVGRREFLLGSAAALVLACLADGGAQAAVTCNPVSSVTLPNATSRVDETGFTAAISAAKTYFHQDPAQCAMTDFTIAVAGGTYDFSADRVPAGHSGLIEFLGIDPPSVDTPTGPKQLHLVLRGAGSAAETTGTRVGAGPGSNYIASQLWSSSPNATTLITHKNERAIFGRNSSHIVIENMVFMQDFPTASQGIVSFPYGSEPPGELTVDIQPGYAPPTIEYVDCRGNRVYEPRTRGCTYAQHARNLQSERSFVNDAHVLSGRLLRVYDNANPLDPVLDQSSDNRQLEWGRPASTPDGWRQSIQPDRLNHPDRWTMYVNPGIQMPSVYTQGALVCIKSKIGGYLAMRFEGPGSDVRINNIRWIGNGESAFLGNTAGHAGMTQVTVTNSENVRLNPVNGQRQCLASSFGGLQIGGPIAGGFTAGNAINNYFAENTGDDSVAFFDDNPTRQLPLSYIANSTINDSFARTIVSIRSKVSNLTEAHLNVSAPHCNGSILDGKTTGSACPVLSLKK